MSGYGTLAIWNFTCGIIAAKWALELGYNQYRQLLYLIGGILFGPLILLILYQYLILKAKADGKTGATWWG